jgi:beta-hydroxylase
VATAINRWVSRNVIKASASANVEGERIGGLNRVFRFFDQIDVGRRKLKNWSKPAYFVVKWGLIGGIIAAVVL